MANINKVAIVFSGGPAPAANAVIGSAAYAFLNKGIDVVGIKHGYSNLINFDGSQPLKAGEHYMPITHADLLHRRSSPGIMIGTARANPGERVKKREDLQNDECTAPLKRVYEALLSLDVDALVSIGGDDTLRTANLMKLYQETLPPEAKRIPVVHLPKTIDNDYMGIDFTFGYFTAAEFLASEIRNLNYDAAAGRAFFLCELMGRHAGWLAYGAAIAGEACMVMSVEDLEDDWLYEEELTDEQGYTATRTVMDETKVVEQIVRVMRARVKQGHPYGVCVVAEGLAKYLRKELLDNIQIDEFGNIRYSAVDLGKKLAGLVAKEFEKQTGNKCKVTPLQLGYESRCAPPHAFDVMLGSQLGIGAYRALVEKQLDGVMVSVVGQLELTYVPFERLVDPATLTTKVRFIDRESDFYKLARFVEAVVAEED